MDLNGVQIDTKSCRVGSLLVSGKGVPRFSVMWNNPISKSSIAILVPYTDEVEEWVREISRNHEDGYVRLFELVYESEDKTAQLIMSGEGAVYPHLFGRNEIAVITIVDIPHLNRKAVDLTLEPGT